MNGRARGFTTLDDDEEVVADWSTGKVGMTGTSYNGTLPIGVASTGVEGLEAIVPVSAISDWYDYYRSNGLVVAPGGYQGEDADILAAYVHTRLDRTVCADQIVAMQQAQDRTTGDRNAFWDERNYLTDVDQIQAATLITVDFTSEPVDTVIPVGSTLSVMVYSSDNEYTVRPAPGSVLEVDLSGTTTDLPVVGGPLALATATDDVPAYATALVAWAADEGLLSVQNEKQLTTGLERVLAFADEGKDHQAFQHLAQFVKASERVSDPTLRADLLEVAAELGALLDAGPL